MDVGEDDVSELDGQGAIADRHEPRIGLSAIGMRRKPVVRLAHSFWADEKCSFLLPGKDTPRTSARGPCRSGRSGRPAFLLPGAALLHPRRPSRQLRTRNSRVSDNPSIVTDRLVQLRFIYACDPVPSRTVTLQF